MSIIIPKGGDFEPAPEGQHAAICCDVEDLGEVESTYKDKTSTKHKARAIWLIDKNMEDGRPYLVSKRYNISSHPNATLVKDVTSWLNGMNALTDPEGNYDMEKMIGQPALLHIVHNKLDDGRVFANVNVVMSAPDGMTIPEIPKDYVRAKDRELSEIPI